MFENCFVAAQRASERSERRERSVEDEPGRMVRNRCRGGTTEQHEQREQSENSASQKMHKGFFQMASGVVRSRLEKDVSTRVDAALIVCIEQAHAREALSSTRFPFLC